MIRKFYFGHSAVLAIFLLCLGCASGSSAQPGGVPSGPAFTGSGGGGTSLAIMTP